jgi:cephalosporin hydroxylase
MTERETTIKHNTLRDIVEAIEAESSALGLNIWVSRVDLLKPTVVIELGTGQGATARIVAAALPGYAVLYTVNYDYPDFSEFGGQLDGAWYVCTVRRVNGDTTNPATLLQVPDKANLMFMDTHHEAWCASVELELWQDKLVDGAIVIVDDIEVADMRDFWRLLPYEKYPIDCSRGQGYFRYDASVRYKSLYTRQQTPKEIAGR